jgi:hypothetical protein
VQPAARLNELALGVLSCKPQVGRVIGCSERLQIQNQIFPKWKNYACLVVHLLAVHTRKPVLLG